MELYAIGPFWSSFQALECQHVNSIWASQSWWWLPHEIHRWSKALWTPTLSIGWRRELVEFAARWLRGLERACHDVCWWLDGCCTWWRWWKINRLYEFFLCEALLGCMMLYAKCSLRVFVVDPSSLETRIYTQDFVGRIQESCRYIQTTQISHRYHADITQISHKSRGNPISFWKLLPSDTVRRFGCCASKPPGWAVKSREPQRWWTSSPMPHFQCISM
jgi:hypothetical protein